MEEVVVVSSNNKKREREGSESEELEEKRLRSDLLLGIFDDDNDAGSEDGLASVMKSFEEEIALPSPIAPTPPPPPPEATFDSGELQQPDLGYLLEASDDELGLPPTVEEVLKVSGDMDAGFGQIWGLADELPEYYEGLEYGAFRPEESESVFDGELFVYGDEVYQPSDLAELSWRPESLPAV